MPEDVLSIDTEYSTTMDAPTIRPKFLKNGHELGLVAVGFSGGQVRAKNTALSPREKEPCD